MTADEYSASAMVFRAPSLSKDDALLNSVMGLCGESGEAIDHVKKARFHGHALDREALVKELGDVAWYLAEAAWALDVSLDEVLSKNLEKLQKRYPDGFSAERSIHRTE